MYKSPPHCVLYNITPVSWVYYIFEIDLSEKLMLLYIFRDIDFSALQREYIIFMSIHFFLTNVVHDFRII